MTFTENGKIASSESDMQNSPLAIGEALKQSLLQAVNQTRLTRGIYECVKLLSCNPDNVMLCVMPEAQTEDVAVHIQHTLIEAFCWENEIKLLKVDSAEKMAKILSNCEKQKDDDENAEGDGASPEDMSCVLVEFPKTEESSEDRQVDNFWQTVMSGQVYPKPIIDLPV